MEFSTRQRDILSLIRSEGQVEVDHLAADFDVTTQTIRRDLALLCDRGLAARTHGGARRIVTVTNLAYEERRRLNSTAKEAIGTAAAGLIPANCSVILNIGTTTEHVARALVAHDGLVVLSNNVNIISCFVGSQVKELILVGGNVRQSDGAIVGDDAVAFISNYKVDYAIIGASALDDDGAIMDFDGREVAVARAILRNARTKILVADHSKFERTAPVRIASVADLDYVVMDKTPSDQFSEAARRGDTRVILTGDDA